MTRLTLAFVATLLCACNNGGTGGGAGGGGGGGGANGADAGYVSVVDPTGTAGIAFADSIDASLISLQVPDASVDDGGWLPTISFGPDGMQFQPAAAAGFRFQTDVSDAGIQVPLWAMRASDGGLESVAATTFIDQGGSSIGLATVPHFSQLVQLKEGLRASLEILEDKAVHEVGETILFSVTARAPGSTISGNLSFDVSGALFNTTGGTTFTDVNVASTPFNYLPMLCQKPGRGLLVVLGTLTAYPRRTSEAGPQPAQEFRLFHEFTCIAPPQPKKEPVWDPSRGSISTLPSSGKDPGSLSAAARFVLRDLARPIEVDKNSLSVKLKTSCGLNGDPCGVSENYLTHYGDLEITNTSPNPIHFGQVPEDNGVDTGGGDPIKFGYRSEHEYFPLPITLAVGQTTTVTFKFYCYAQGRGSVKFRARASFAQRSSLPTWAAQEDTFQTLLPLIRCGGEGDAVMLSDNTRLTRSGSIWTPMATGVTANLIASSDAISSNFAALNSESVGLDAITAFTGRLGLPRFRFASGRQTATWTHNGNGYVQTGLVAGAAYNATDSLTVTGQLANGSTAVLPDGGPAVVVLSAPPPLPAGAQLFGAREGLSTRVRLPDGTFDVLYIALTAPSPAGGTGGIFRTVLAANMPLDAGIREAPVMDPASLRALSAWGIDAGTVYIAAYRQQDVEGFFTNTDGGVRRVPVQAGRMVQVSVSDLSP